MNAAANPNILALRPDFRAIARWVEPNSTVLDAGCGDGSLLRAFAVEDGLWRLAPPRSGVDPQFMAMLIAWEDRRFADHDGIDPRAIARAGWQALRHGRVVSGASTLSMQTARLLERGPTGDWRAKLRQARVALALERRLGKARVLDLYLRLAPYGGNTEGVRAASLMWFGKEPRRLTPAESALLATLSPREKQVLDLVVASKPNKIIADILGISIKTVELHRANMMHKLGVRSLPELMKVALNG